MFMKIKYNGTRFPRTVFLQGNKRTSFQADKKVLELDEYDALGLLKFNNRISPTVWEFTIEGLEARETILPPAAPLIPAPKEEEKPSKDKPKAKQKSKSGKR